MRSSAACGVDRYRETDADEVPVLRWVGQCRDDPDHLTVAIEQWTAGVARIDCRVELDQTAQRAAVVARDRTVETRDHAPAERIDKAERMSYRKCFVTDTDAAAHYRGHDHPWLAFRGEYRDVVVRVGRCDGRGRLGAVGERDSEAGGFVDDV